MKRLLFLNYKQFKYLPKHHDYPLVVLNKNKKCIVSVVKEFNDKTQKEENNIKAFKQIEEDLQEDCIEENEIDENSDDERE